MISFLAFVVAMAAIVFTMWLKAKRSKVIDKRTEEVAKVTLPTIGAIAEKKYTERYGQAPKGAPSGQWYPALKHQIQKGAK